MNDLRTSAPASGVSALDIKSGNNTNITLIGTNFLTGSNWLGMYVNGHTTITSTTGGRLTISSAAIFGIQISGAQLRIYGNADVRVVGATPNNSTGAPAMYFTGSSDIFIGDDAKLTITNNHDTNPETHTFRRDGATTTHRWKITGGSYSGSLTNPMIDVTIPPGETVTIERELIPTPTIAITSTGLTGLKVGQPVTGSVVFTLSDGTYATPITAADFAVSGLPAGLSAGTAVRTSGTVVTVPITGTPTTANASTTALTLPSSIPQANVTGATAAITPAGTVTASAVAKGGGAAVSGAPTVNGTPDAGYMPESVTVYRTGNATETVPVKTEGDGYTFVMPPYEVTIVVTFTPAVGNEELRVENGELRVFVQNGVLYISGAADGATLRVYSIVGNLVYQGIAIDDKAEIMLSGRGIYIIPLLLVSKRGANGKAFPTRNTSKFRNSQPSPPR